MAANRVKEVYFNKAVDVTPSDSADLAALGAVLNIKTAGNVKVRTSNGDVVTLAAPVGTLPVYVDRVYSTNTTASGITALYHDSI
jgi:formylmethanofuran dehydrogenase subunit D